MGHLSDAGLCLTAEGRKQLVPHSMRPELKPGKASMGFLPVPKNEKTNPALRPGSGKG